MSGSTLRREYRFAIAPEHLVRDKRLSDRAVRLYLLLDRYAGDKAVAFPSRARLADDLTCSRESVDRAIIELVETGWLAKRRREAGSVNEYTMLVAPSSPETTGVVIHDDTPSSSATTGVVTGDAVKEASPENQGSETETPRRSAPRKRTRIPTPWVISDRCKAWASEHYPALDPRQFVTETEHFVGHHQARGSTFLDWDAAWMNWMRRAAERMTRPSATARVDTGYDQGDAVKAQQAEMFERGTG